MNYTKAVRTSICPNCGEDLETSLEQGNLISICPSCDGRDEPNIQFPGSRAIPVGGYAAADRRFRERLNQDAQTKTSAEIMALSDKEFEDIVTLDAQRSDKPLAILRHPKVVTRWQNMLAMKYQFKIVQVSGWKAQLEENLSIPEKRLLHNKISKATKFKQQLTARLVEAKYLCRDMTTKVQLESKLADPPPIPMPSYRRGLKKDRDFYRNCLIQVKDNLETEAVAPGLLLQLITSWLASSDREEVGHPNDA